MKRLSTHVIALLALLTVVPIDAADVVGIRLIDTYGFQARTLAPGATFTVFVELFDTGGGALPLMTAGQLEMESDRPYVSLDSVTFGQGWSSDPLFAIVPSAGTVLAPRSGVMGTYSEEYEGTTNPVFAELAFTLDAAWTGVLTLSVFEPFFSDQDFNEFEPIKGSGYQVTVIPAPQAVVLSVIGVGTLLLRRRRAL